MRQLGLFTKYWEPGLVKTRLAKAIGDQAAAQLHREFLKTTLQTFQSFQAERLLSYWPRERRSEFEALAGNSWTLAPQTTGNLGIRMQSYFTAALEAKYQQAVLIGSDSPTLPPCIVETAFEKLQQHDVVIGPARDGGYYLIGCSQAVPGIFDDIDWGSGQVFEQTTTKLNSLGIRHAVLAEWYDIDQLEDLINLEAELKKPDHRQSWPPALIQLVTQVLEAFPFHDHSDSS